jgi:hypothetical protein
MAMKASVMTLTFFISILAWRKTVFFCSKIDTVNLPATFRDAFDFLR